MKTLLELVSKATATDWRVANGVRRGTVSHVDPAQQRFRMRLGGSDEEPFLSPWIPYGQTAGAMKLHSPPSVGQQFVMVAAGGDWRQSVAFPYTWSDANQSPSQKGDEHVLTFGNVKIEIRGDEVILTVPRLFLKCGDATLEITGDGFNAAMPQVKWTVG